jgi:outer membrane protein
MYSPRPFTPFFFLCTALLSSLFSGSPTCVFHTLGCSPAYAADLKFAYIRPQYIFSKYEPYREAQRQIETFQKTELEKLQKMTDEYQNKVKDTESKAILMTEEILKTKREELKKQKEQLDSIYNDLYKKDGRLETKQKELLTPILDRINGVLMRIGKNDGYDFIFDAEGPVLYANPKHDLSDYVLKELEKETPKK